MCIITLIFGLHPKDFGQAHTPTIDPDGNLRFTKYAIATTNVSNATQTHDSVIERTTETKLAITLAIAAMPDINHRFSIIFSLNNSVGESLLLLGQWKQSLVVMTGEDYANLGNQPRITIPLETVEGYVYPNPLQLSLEATAGHTEVTINNQLMSKSASYIAPQIPGRFSIALGNSLNRKHGWLGAVSYFELHLSSCEKALTASQEASCEKQYSTYLNPEYRTRSIGETGSSEWVLHSPYTVLKTQWLASGFNQPYRASLFNKDLLINLLGFMPVTLAIFILFASRFQLTHTALLTILCTCLLSLLIESLQVFLPSRTSSQIDLTVNSFAGVVTTLLCYTTSRWLGIPKKALRTGPDE